MPTGVACLAALRQEASGRLAGVVGHCPMPEPPAVRGPAGPNLGGAS